MLEKIRTVVSCKLRAAICSDYKVLNQPKLFASSFKSTEHYLVRRDELGPKFNDVVYSVKGVEDFFFNYVIETFLWLA